MLLERIYDEDLAQASYFIGCQAKGEAVVVDARRDVAEYLDLAQRHGMRIVAVTETHIHADYLSGTRELAATTGADVYVSGEGGQDWQYGFEAERLYHGSTISIGNITIEARHTPGHTPEHLALLVTDGAFSDAPGYALTGDFVFAGDLGRPDLLDEAAGGMDTRFEGARQLFASLRDEFLTLGDHVQVFPAHGAGSACGKALGALPSTTVGYERLNAWWAPYLQNDDEQGFIDELLDGQPDALYTDTLELDLGSVEPCISGPKRPQDRILLKDADSVYEKHLKTAVANRKASGKASAEVNGENVEIRDGAVLIAAITSCTNTSNPAVMVAAGLLARNAREKGLKAQPWVKTSLAPGSRVVTDYLEKADLLDDLDAIGFYTVGYGCTTCIGNSGPLLPSIADAVTEGDVVGTSVLSGNRNFEGRIHPLVRMNFLASPPLVVAYALAGNLDVNLLNDPLGKDKDGKPVYLKDIWPSQREIHDVVGANIDSTMFKSSYGSVFEGDSNWKNIDSPEGEIYTWDDASTYVKNPPYFDGMTRDPAAVQDVRGARVLALLGDSVTTDHISPAGSIAKDSPAARYLIEQGVQPVDFNSYGSRRGNHEVMMRGTFANIRLRNLLAPGTEGGWTRHQPSGEQMSIFDAAQRYEQEGTPLVVIAGSEYGTGSSRDWAAKGTLLLGVRAVIAKSFERIHRSNLIGMGVLPLQFQDGQDAESLGLDGTETFDIVGQTDASAKTVTVTATPASGKPITFEARVRIDTPKERDYYEHGGILHYVLRQLAA